jgi:hypothetical protein
LRKIGSSVERPFLATKRPPLKPPPDTPNVSTTPAGRHLLSPEKFPLFVIKIQRSFLPAHETPQHSLRFTASQQRQSSLPGQSIGPVNSQDALKRSFCSRKGNLERLPLPGLSVRTRKAQGKWW